MSIASELIGAPSMKYVHGNTEIGESPDRGFDCSGFIKFVLNSAGIAIPDFIGADNRQRPTRHVNEFWDHFGVPIHNEFHQPGDLIFFSRDGTFPTHIGIMRDKETYIHAQGKDNTKVVVAEIREEIIALQREMSQIYRKNPIGFKSPTIALEKPTYRYHQKII